MSVVTAPAVPLPTLLTAAAWALVALSPVTGFSAASCSAEPWAGVSAFDGVAVVDDESDAADAVAVVDGVAAIAVPMRVAPTAPPVRVAAASAPPITILRTGFIGDPCGRGWSWVVVLV